VDAIVNPLFDVKNISKEINNVNSEISMRMTYNK
jgi:secreted Zn-dependent insulinase-like peptidase